MPKNRSTVSVAELINQRQLVVGDGYRAKNSELAPAGIPFARGQNINNGFLFDTADRFPEKDLNKVGDKVSQQGDVVFTSKGTVGRFAYVREDTPRFVYSPQLCFWRSLDYEKIDPKWLFYWMQSQEFFAQYKAVAGQTDMAEYVSLRDQRQFQITLPAIDKQRTIAAVLGALDDKIELNRQMNRTLEAIARTLFKSWFVDFDPVRAKMEGRPSNLPPDLDALFPDSFEDSELGEIPAGWKVEKLGDLIDLAYGKGLVEAKRIPGSVPVFGSNGQVGWHNERLVEGPGAVVGRKGNPGTVTWAYTDFYPIDTTFYVVTKGKSNNLYYLYHALQLQNLPALSADSAVPGLNRNLAYMNLQVMPSAELLRHFESFVMPLFASRHTYDQESRTLAAIRDTLLPKLLSGEIRVKDIEI